MAIYHMKRALEILRKEGRKELGEEISEFIIKKTKLPGKILASYQIRVKINKHERYDLPKIIETSPQKISWRTTLSRKMIPARDSSVQEGLTTPNQAVVGVIGGRWDVYKKKWERTGTYKSLVERFEYGKDWSETSMFRDTTMKKRKDIDILYESIKNKGYIPTSELIKNSDMNEMKENSPHKVNIGCKKYPDECCIGVGRNGELIRLAGGSHRVSISKILSLEKIPVLVLTRHKQWQQFRDEIQNNGLPESREHLRDHPDLRDVLE